MRTLEIHGLLPFLGMEASGASALPDNVRQLVLKHTLRSALYHANALDAMNDVSREMRAVHVPYAMLKGP